MIKKNKPTTSTVFHETTIQPDLTPEAQPTISQRKLEANRNNGRKSQGPKTHRGKSISRWNAVKHGLMAKSLTIGEGRHMCGYEEFTQLRDALREEHQPRTAEEELALEMLAVNYWLRSLLLKHEIVEIGRKDAFFAPGVDRVMRYSTMVDRRLQASWNRVNQLAAERGEAEDAATADWEATDAAGNFASPASGAGGDEPTVSPHANAEGTTVAPPAADDTQIGKGPVQ